MEAEEVGAGPDLATQLEGLLAAVWAAEENWRFDDRIALSDRVDQSRRDRSA